MDRENPMAFKNTIRECGTQIAYNLSYEERLQLLAFLAQIAKSDGHVCAEEIEALKEVALSMDYRTERSSRCLIWKQIRWKRLTRFLK